ncbi:MAG: hypothetical protein WBA10_03675 [Elainellaceae cyanobacterium]
MSRDSYSDPSLGDDPNSDNMKRDRFELLSAYLDGEVTPAERQQVLLWLEQDQTMQCLYARLLKLRRGLQCMPVPPSNASIEDTLAKVQSRIKRRPRRAMAAWGGTAIAALFVSVVMGSLTVPGAINWFGSTEEVETEAAADKAITVPDAIGNEALPDGPVPTDALILTIEQPVVPIPMAVEPVEKPESADASIEQPVDVDGELNEDAPSDLL